MSPSAAVQMEHKLISSHASQPLKTQCVLTHFRLVFSSVLSFLSWSELHAFFFWRRRHHFYLGGRCSVLYSFSLALILHEGLLVSERAWLRCCSSWCSLACCSFIVCVCQVPWNPEVDLCWHSLVCVASEECEPEWCASEDPLFILYTSGSTGKPKVHRLTRFHVSTHTLGSHSLTHLLQILTHLLSVSLFLSLSLSHSLPPPPPPPAVPPLSSDAPSSLAPPPKQVEAASLPDGVTHSWPSLD